MAEIKKVPKAKLFFGLLFAKSFEIVDVIKRIELDFGRIDARSDVVPFNHTEYYADEMGAEIMRLFITSEELMDMDELADAKNYTNLLEKAFSDPVTGNRRVNIDPGYLTLSKVVLATTKDYDHRLYLKSGIYAEVTLRYKRRNNSYEAWKWTYPDYREPFAMDFFNRMRMIYHEQIKTPTE